MARAAAATDAAIAAGVSPESHCWLSFRWTGWFREGDLGCPSVAGAIEEKLSGNFL